MTALQTWEILALTGVSFVAATLDAVGGGGGLLTLPALMAAGLPPREALGTNKGQSVFGSLAALVRFARGGAVDRRRAAVTFPLGFVGSVAGALLVLVLAPRVLRPLVIVLLVAAAIMVGIHHRRSPTVGARPLSRSRLAAGAIALGMGAYDGFFGPGTGAFLIVAFSVLLGDGLGRATADAKVVNLASNLAAAIVFGVRGTVLWQVALPMAAAQAVGGWLGAHIVLRRGDRLVRAAVVGVALLLAAKLAADLWAPGG